MPLVSGFVFVQRTEDAPMTLRILASLLCLLTCLSADHISAQSTTADIVFAALCTNGESRLFLINADGSNYQQITDANSAQPTWLRSGTAIGYLRAEAGTWTPTIYTLETGQNHTLNPNITFSHPNDSYAWSNTGDYVAFIFNGDLPRDV